MHKTGRLKKIKLTKKTMFETSFFQKKNKFQRTKKTPNRNKMHKNRRLKTIEQKQKPPMFETSSFFLKKEEVSNDEKKCKLETKCTKTDA